MISVIIPVYNEEGSLNALQAELAAVTAGGELGPFEFVFVDDGSRDGSWDKLTALAAGDPRVRAIRFRRNFGKAAALTAGFQAARGKTMAGQRLSIIRISNCVPGWASAGST